MNSAASAASDNNKTRTRSGASCAIAHGRQTDLARCEVWTLRDGAWAKHAPIPAGTGTTMRGIEHATKEAGLAYPRGDEGRRRAHWRASVSDIGPAGFELPLMLGRER